MTNEIINIFTSKKIIAETLTNKFKSLYQININYFDPNIKKIIFIDLYLNIIFISPSFTTTDCNLIIKKLTNIDKSKILICIDKKFNSTFSKFKNNLILYPVHFSDLEKKINILSLSTLFIFNDIQLDKKNKKIINTISKSNVLLTSIETNILVLLINSQQSVSKEEINSRVLGYSKNVNSHSLDSHIYRLRKKLVKVSSKTEIITKDKGFYKII